MNDPETANVDVEEQRAWLNAHKKETGFSWTDVSRKVSVLPGTISVFAGGKYQGDNLKIARAIFKYRQLIATQADLSIEAPEIPPYFETPTSRRIQSLLSWAQRGRITMIAAGPGTGKTSTLRHYRESVSNVWLSTMTPSTSSLPNMLLEVLDSMLDAVPTGTPQQLSKQVRQRVDRTGGLIAIDEAQHLTEKALEEIRAWHDATGIGIAILGNEHVVTRMEGGSRKSAFAQLYSRVGMRLIQHLPTEGDALAFCAAWGVEDAKERTFITALSQKPGGLRGCSMTMELATMLAAGERRRRDINDLQDAWAQLSTRQIAA